MHTICHNPNTLTYKLLEKAYGTLQTEYILLKDENLSLDESFAGRNIEDISIDEIKTEANRIGRFTKEAIQAYYNKKQEETESAFLKQIGPTVAIGEHLKRWWGIDPYDLNNQPFEITADQMMDYVQKNFTGEIHQKVILDILDKYVKEQQLTGKGSNNDLMQPIRIELDRMERHYSIAQLSAENSIMQGHFDPSSNTVRLFYDGLGVHRTEKGFIDALIQVFAHELIHSLTFHSYEINPKFKREIDQLYQKAKEGWKELYKDSEEVLKAGESLYGWSTAHEFMSEALTNPEFQRVLALIPYSENISFKTSLWDFFIDLLNKYVINFTGFKNKDIKNTMLEAVITSVSNRMEINRVIQNNIRGKKAQDLTLYSIPASKVRLNSIRKQSTLIENETKDEYWRNLYLNPNITNYEDFESIEIPTIKNKFQPDLEHVYHGTNIYQVDSNGNLILNPSKNFDGKTNSISFTQIPVVAQDYMLRKNGNVIIKINNNALNNRFDIESSEEIAVNTNKPLIVSKDQYKIIRVRTLEEKMNKKYTNDVDRIASEIENNVKSDLELLDVIYSIRINTDNYSEIREYSDFDISEHAPKWYVSDEYLNNRAAKKIYNRIKDKIDKKWIIDTLSNVLIERIKNSGVKISNYEDALHNISEYGNKNAPHQSTLFEELLSEINLNNRFDSSEKQIEYRELIESIKDIVEKKTSESIGFYNSPEQIKLREEQKERDRLAMEYLRNQIQEQGIDDIPFSTGITEQTVLTYFQKLGIVNRNKFQDRYWIKMTNDNQLLRHLGILARENAKAIGQYGVPALLHYKKGKGVVVEVNPEYLIRVNTGQRTAFKTLQEEVSVVRELESSLRWLRERFGDEIGIHLFNDTVRVGDRFAHGWFDAAGIHLWNQSIPGIEYHEAFHAVFRLYTAPKQKNILYAEAREKYGKNLSELDLEERMADDFMGYMLHKQNLRGFDAILDFFEELIRYLTHYFTSRNELEKIFRQIRSNKIDKSFSRSLNSLGKTRAFKSIPGFSKFEENVVAESASQIFDEERAKAGDSSAQQYVFENVRNRFIQFAFMQRNGKMLDEQQGRFIADKIAVISDLKAKAAAFRRDKEEQEKIDKLDKAIVEQKKLLSDFINIKSIVPMSALGSTQEEQLNYHNLFLRIFNNWKPKKDDFGNTLSPGFEKLLRNKLKDKNILVSQKKIVDEDDIFKIDFEDYEVVWEKIYNMPFFYENLRDKLSTEVKVFLKSIPVIDPTTGEPKKNFMGFVEMIPFEDLYADVALSLTINTGINKHFDNSSFRGMINTLEGLSKTKPHLGLIAKMAVEKAKADPRFASKFFNSFANFYYHFTTISHEWEIKVLEQLSNQGASEEIKQTTIKLFDSNRRGLDRRILDEWNTNAIATSSKKNPDAIYREDEKGNLIVNKDQVLKAVEILNDWDRDIKQTLEERVDRYSRYLAIFGVHIPKEHLIAYVNVTAVRYQGHKPTEQDKILALSDLLGGDSKTKTVSIESLVYHFAKIKRDKTEKIVIDKEDVRDIVPNVHVTYSKLFARLAKVASIYQIGDSGTFTKSSGQVVYPINQNTPLTDAFMTIKSGKLSEKAMDDESEDEFFTSDYYKDEAFVPQPLEPGDNATYKYKSILLQLSEKEAFRESFQLSDLDSFKEKNEAVAKLDFDNLNESASMIVRMNAFCNNNNSRNSLFPVPTMGDRKRMTFLTMPRYENFRDFGMYLDQETIIRGYIEQDIRRIHNAHDLVDRVLDGTLSESQLIEGYHYKKGTKNKTDKSGNAFKFWNIYGINEKTVLGTAMLYENGSNVQKEVYLNDSRKNFLQIPRETRNQIIDSIVKDFLQNKLPQLVDQLVYEMITYKIVNGKIDPKTKEITFFNYKDKATTKLNRLDHKLNKDFLSRFEDDSILESLRSFAESYLFNNLIYSNEITNFTNGSRGYFKNYADFNKRFGGQGTPGLRLVQQGDIPGNPEYGVPRTFRESCIYDLYHDQAHAKELSDSLRSVLDKKNEHLADAYDWTDGEPNVNKTDASGVITLKFARSLMQGMSTWSPKHEEAYLNHLKNGEFRDNEGKAPALIPIKPYYDGVILQNGSMVRVMIKNSFVVLLPEYTKNHPQLDKLRKKMEENDIDAINTDSTRKVERHGMVDITQPDYNLVVSELPSEHLRIPQIIPDTNETPRYGSQFRKDILANIFDEGDYTIYYNDAKVAPVKGFAMRTAYNNVLNRMIENSKEELYRELGYTQLKNTFDKWTDEEDFDKKAELWNEYVQAQLNFLQTFRQKVEEQVEDRDLSDNYLESLDIVSSPTGGYQFRVPLSFPVFSKKFNQIVFAMFRNNVMDQRISGFSAVQMAEMGSWAREKADGTSKEEPLKFIHGENGEIVEGECAVKWSVAKRLGLKPGDSLENIPKKFRTLIGYRIPTQGKNSMLPMTVKYILPDSYSHAILLPGEVTKQMGSDYDIDKMFVITPNFQFEGLNDHVKSYLKSHNVPNTRDFMTRDKKEFLESYANNGQIPEGNIDQDYQLLMDAVDSYKDQNIELKVKRIPTDWTKILANDLSKMSRKELENSIFDIAWSILMNKHTLPDIIRSIDDNILGDQAEFFKKQNVFGEGDELNFNYPGTEITLEMRNKAASVGIGGYANYLSAHNLAQYTNIKTPPIGLHYRVIEQGKNEQKVVFDKKEVFNTLGRKTDINGDLISTNISRHLNIAVDNAKNPIPFFVNDNAITSGVIGFLASIGFPDDAITYITMQPLILEFTNRVRLENIYSDQYKDLAAKICTENQLPVFDIHSFYEEPIELKITTLKDTDGNYLLLTGNLPLIEQQKLLYTFIRLAQYGTKHVRLNKVLAADRVSDISSIAAIENYLDIRDAVLRDRDFVVTEEDLKKNNPVGESFFENGILETKDFFLFSGLFSDLLTAENKSIFKTAYGREILDKNVYERLTQEMSFMAYQLQNKQFFTQQIFNRLFRDPQTNLVAEWNRLKEDVFILQEIDGQEQKIQSLSTNRFFNNYQEKYNPKNPYAILQFNSSLKLSADEKNRLKNDLEKLLYEPGYYSADPAVQDRIRQFAEDAIIANLWQFGFSPSANNIMEYIPIRWYQTDFINLYHELDHSSLQKTKLQLTQFGELFLEYFALNNVSLDKFMQSFRRNDKKIVFNPVLKTMTIEKSRVINTFKNNSSETTYTTFVKVFNYEKRKYDVYRKKYIGEKTVTYGLLEDRGIPYQMKEYLVFTDDLKSVRTNSLIDPSLQINYKSSENAVNLNEEITEAKVVPIRGVGDISEFLAKLPINRKRVLAGDIRENNAKIKCVDKPNADSPDN